MKLALLPAHSEHFFLQVLLFAITTANTALCPTRIHSPEVLGNALRIADDEGGRSWMEKSLL